MSRVRMPHNNRVSASAALRTNDMWSRTIGHDPYAADNEKGRQQDQDNSDQAASLMLLAKMSNLSGVESRGGCKKCGMLGHMTFQCRNASGPVVENDDSSSSSSSDDDDDDDVPPRASVRSAQDTPHIPSKVDSGRKRAHSESDSESDRSERKSSKKHKKSKDSDKKSKKDKKEKKHKSDKDKKHKHKKSKKSSRSSP